MYPKTQEFAYDGAPGIKILVAFYVIHTSRLFILLVLLYHFFRIYVHNNDFYSFMPFSNMI